MQPLKVKSAETPKQTVLTSKQYRGTKGKVILHPWPPDGCRPQPFHTHLQQSLKNALSGMNYGSWSENEPGGNVFTGSSGSLFPVTSTEMFVQMNTGGVTSAAHMRERESLQPSSNSQLSFVSFPSFSRQCLC